MAINKLHSPLYVMVGKKKIYLNLNVYRNLHHQALNKAKINYKAIIADQVIKLPIMDRIMIQYVLYPKTRRLTDLDNVISIHAKFLRSMYCF